MSTNLIRLFIVVPFLSFHTALGQVEIVPKWFDVNDSITVRYSADQGNAALKGMNTVYGHFGLLTDQSIDSSDWKFIVGHWGKEDPEVRMNALGNDQFEIGYTISSFHGLNGQQQVNALSMVFRNSEGTVVGKNTDESDFIHYGSDGSFQSGFTNTGANSLRVLPSSSASLRGECSVNASVRLQLDGQEVAQASSAKVIEYTFHGDKQSAGMYQLTLEIDTGTGYFATDSLTIERLQAGTPLDPPAGREDGITILSQTRVHLQLRAPGKSWAFALGDFNNWQLDSAYLMTPSTDGQSFWIEIDQLDPQTKYRFQYYVGPQGIKIADPYSELVLDPWNDQYIGQATYPNRPFYPANQNGHVSVFQTGEIGYSWDNGLNYQRPDNRDLVIYELLLRDFDPEHSWKELMDRMDYFEALNINAIQLMPVMEFEGNESWGYNPSYMCAPDKYYGPKKDLKKFIEECHRRDIAVILDITLNHQFGQSPLAQLYWDDVNNRTAPDNPWFNEYPKHPFNVGYDMNHESVHTQYFTKRVFKHWLEEYRVDGFRMDLSKGFTQTDNLYSVSGWNAYDQGRINRLNDYGQHIWSVTPGAFVILEHFAGNAEESALSNNGFMLWGDMNYSYNQAVMGYGSDLSGTLASNRGWWGKNLVAYMESHDEERLCYEAKVNGNAYNGYSTRNAATYADRHAMGAVLLLSTPGPKMFWQFGEMGYDYSINFCIGDSSISGGCHINNKPIRWDYLEEPHRKAAFSIWSDMIYLRTNQNAFRNDPIEYNVSGLVKKIRLQDQGRHFVIVANTDVAWQNANAYFPFPGTWYSLLESDSLSVGSNFPQISLAPGAYKVFCNEPIDLPNAPFSPDLLPDYLGICPTAGEVLTAAPGYGPYLWSDGSTGNTLSVVQDGWNSVQVTNSFGRTHTDSVWVNIDCQTAALGTDLPSLITANSAQFHGRLVSSGNSSIDSIGFVFGTASGPSLGNNAQTTVSGGSSFQASVNGLLPGVTYYVRSYAVNAAGIAYGNERSFLTAAGNYDLTFRVDMREQTIHPNGIHVAGDFQQLAGFASNWDPSSCVMSDPDQDSIYELTVNIPIGSYEFKFINGNDWSGGEGIDPACASAQGNRFISIATDFSTVPFCFGSCWACDTTGSGIFDLTFQVDMGQETVDPSGVHVGGDFQAIGGFGSNWNPSTAQMLDPDGDGVYELTVTLPVGTYQYKFVNGNSWGKDESVPPACSGNSGDRSIDVTGDMSTPSICFEACRACSTSPLPNVDITFQVDMSQQTISPNGIHVAGNFQAAAGFGSDWNPSSSSMSDPDGDSIYTLTVSVPAGTYQYKFVNGNSWGVDESVPSGCATSNNRELTATASTSSPLVCFSSCSPCSQAPPQTLYNLTLQVDMSQVSTLSANGVHVAGSFQAAAGYVSDWNPSSTPLSDPDGDSIYTLTVQIPAGIYEYKFINGKSFTDDEDIPSYCSFNNNRGIVLTGDTTLPVICYSACESCTSIPNNSHTLTFHVDMRQEVIDSAGVHVTGTFALAAGLDTVNWLADALELLDPDGDMVYSGSVVVPTGVYEFKYVNGINWGQDEQLVGGCLSGNNRVIMVNADRNLDTVCFGSCHACQPPPPIHSVTFQVDMRQQTIGPNGVHVAGDFQAAAGFASDWDPSSTALSDSDGDSIYTLSVQVPTGNYEYKFINGNSFTDDENLWSQPCQSNGNRSLALTSDSILTAVCYASCSPCVIQPPSSTFNLTFQLDMRQQTISPNGVHVAGDFQVAAGFAGNWDPSATTLSDPDGDSIYTLSVQIPAGNYEYKFINGNAWGEDENMWSEPCQSNGNRSLTLTSDRILTAVCYGSCSPCFVVLPSHQITFRVDMSGVCLSDSVDLAGSMNGWSGGDLLTDANRDGIYETTLTLRAGIYGYKFRNLFSGNIEWEGIANRSVVVTKDSVLPVVCFNSLSPCSGIYPPVDVTFRVHLNGLPADSNGIWVAGDFTVPAWNNGALPLLPTAQPGVYEATTNVCPTTFYWKFVNGDPVTYSGEETFPNGDGSCYVPNGFGGFNRITSRVDSLPLLLEYAFNTCQNPSLLSPPSVQTDSAIQIGIYSAVLGGAVVNDGGGKVTARGVVYDTIPGADLLSSAYTTEGIGTGAFQSSVSGLVPSTTYYYRAYATNLAGSAYGTELSFTTDSAQNCLWPLDSVADVNHNQGVYQAYFSGLTSSGTYKLEWKSAADSVWRSKSIFSPASGQQRFNLNPWFNVQVEVRIKEEPSSGPALHGCVFTLATPCKSMNLQTVEQKAAFCEGDSALVRVGFAGGYGAKTILWSNGATTKRTYAQQGKQLTVVVTDATGCSLTDSISASSINTATSPSDLFVARSAAILTARWNAPSLTSGQSVLFYRVNYRLRGMTSWTSTASVTDTLSIMDWNGSGIAAGNYEFMVVARINDNGTKYTSEPSCIYVRGYNGVGGKAEDADSAEPAGVPSISIYPNPTDHILYVQAPVNSEICLVDLHGKTLTRRTTEHVETSIDMSSYAQGVYLLQIESGEETLRRPVIKN